MIDIDIDQAGIATLTWNMPDRSANVLNGESLAAFDRAVRQVLDDDAVTGIVITSAKTDFLAGADLDALYEADDVEAVFAMAQDFHATARALETGGKPTVAAINGTALGGGFEICLACHRRIAADLPKLRVGQPEVTLGLIPGGGATQRLPRLIGIREALPLLLDGRRVAPTAAQELGLIDAVVPADQLIAEAKRWLASDQATAEQPWDRKGFRIPGGAVWSKGGMETFVAGNALLHKKTRGNYPAPQAIASCVYEGAQLPIDLALKVEARWFTKIATGATAKCMIRTFFFNIGDANKLRHRPAAPPRAALAKVGVLGAGMMGHGIAHVSALAGLDVVLLDSDQTLAEKGKAASAQLLAARVERGRMSQEAADAVLSRIHPTAAFDELKGADLVVEAVFENREVKATVTKAAEAMLDPGAVFASNTSTLPITGLAEASARPDMFIGLHFFSPVERMQLVEIIRGRETGDTCLAKAMDYVQRIGKTPIVVNDSRGFYTSRVFGTYVQEGTAMLAEGIGPALIENAGRLAGMPVGPLAVADEVSLELIHKVAAQTAADLGDAFTPGPGAAAIDLMVNLGRIGKKAGKGFYSYPPDTRKHLWPDLGQHFPEAAEQPDVEQVVKRLLYIQSLETARCLQDNVLTTPADADVGAVLGWGFAPHTGGTAGLIEQVGIAEFVADCERLAQQHGARFTPPDVLRDMAARGERFYGAKAA